MNQQKNIRAQREKDRKEIKRVIGNPEAELPDDLS